MGLEEDLRRAGPRKCVKYVELVEEKGFFSKLPLAPRPGSLFKFSPDVVAEAFSSFRTFAASSRAAIAILSVLASPPGFSAQPSCCAAWFSGRPGHELRPPSRLTVFATFHAPHNIASRRHSSHTSTFGWHRFLKGKHEYLPPILLHISSSSSRHAHRGIARARLSDCRSPVGRRSAKIGWLARSLLHRWPVLLASWDLRAEATGPSSRGAYTKKWEKGIWLWLAARSRFVSVRLFRALEVIFNFEH